MRKGVEVPYEQRRLSEAVAGNGNRELKHARRALIILLADEALGTTVITAKPMVWRWPRRRTVRLGKSGRHRGVGGAWRPSRRKITSHLRKCLEVSKDPRYRGAVRGSAEPGNRNFD